MNMLEGIPLDDFDLDERVFERSKQWSSFMKQKLELSKEDDEEYNFHEIEKLYAKTSSGENNNLDDESDIMDKSVDLNDEGFSDSNEEACNVSVLQLRTFSNSLALKEKQIFRQNLKKSGRIAAETIREELEGEEDDNDIQNIVNQTLPILAERKRKWKESGMLKILNTFDAKKIEEKVGTWLQNNSITHNSLCMPLVLHSKEIKPDPSQIYYTNSRHPISNYGVSSNAPDTEEESLNSIDTARYIRSNCKSRTSSTMNIKSFRLLQSKRNALREKYAFPEDEEYEYQRSKVFHCPPHMLKTGSKMKLCRPYEKKCEISLYDQLTERRRKILNKRKVRSLKANLSSTTSCYAESSDEEGFIENRHNAAKSYRQLCRQKKCSFSRRPTLYNNSLAKFKCDLDERPQKRVSECCCDAAKLCKGIKHLADTSTEEWFVENCFTPRKQSSKDKVLKKQRIINEEKTSLVNTFEKKLKENYKIKTKKHLMIDNSEFKNLAHEKNSKESIPIPKESSNTKVSQTKKSKIDKNKNVIKTQKLSTKKQKAKKQDVSEILNSNSALESSHNTTFERDLKLAIEISKKPFNHANPNKKDENDPFSIPGSITNIVMQKKISKTNHQENSFEKNENTINSKTCSSDEVTQEQTAKPNSHNSTFERDLKLGVHSKTCESDEVTQEKNAKPSALLGSLGKSVSSLTPSNSATPGSSAEKKLKPKPKSLKLRQLQKLKKKADRETLNGNSTAIKNETFFALKNANICNSTAMSNVDIAAEKELSSTPSTRSYNPEKNSRTGGSMPFKSDENDCTIVSSTTCNRKGILLYTPSAPTSFRPSISNGEFLLTKDHLSSVIGEKTAEKFLKHHRGRLRFDANLSIFFRPPRNLNYMDVDSDSDVDPLEEHGEHGELYVTLNE